MNNLNRNQVSVDKMFDTLSSMSGGKFATFCYINVVKMKKTKRTINLDAFGRDLDDNRHEGDDYWYEPLKQFQQDEKMKKNPIYAIISITRYNLNWSTEDSYAKKYSEYANKKDEIDKKYGIYKGPSERRQGDFSDVNTMGISMGNTDNTRNRAYIHQNLHNANKKTYYYVIDKNGDIKGEIPRNAIRSIISTSSNSDVNALKKLQKTDEEIQNYLSEIEDLKFKPHKFIVDKILFIVATINGQRIFYKNDRLPSEIGEININTQAFINLVQILFKQSYNEINEVYQRFKKSLLENKILEALRLSTNEFINEYIRFK